MSFELSAIDIDAPAPPSRGLVGVYFLIHAGVLVWVGKSVHVEQRVLHHIRNNKRFAKLRYPQHILPFDEVRFLPVPDGVLGSVERFLIIKLNPVRNAHRFLRPGDEATAVDLGLQEFAL